MRYSRSQWLMFVALMSLNAATVLVLVDVGHAGPALLVAYAIVIPIVFRWMIVASMRFGLHALWLAPRLLLAMRRGEIVLYIQPKATLVTGEILGAEALARWVHPRRGVLPPAEWLETVQQFAWLERRFFRCTLDAACAQAETWRTAGLDIRLCLNISPCALSHRTTPDEVLSRLRAWELPITVLELEITEEALEGAPRAAANVERLSREGLHFALDDFGVGHSSMQRLASMPFMTLKIDRSFVNGVIGDERNRAVVQSACVLAHSIGMIAVAEGIESVEVLEAVRRLGADVGQGFLISPAIPPASFEGWLAGRHRAEHFTLPGPDGDRRRQFRRQDDRPSDLVSSPSAD